MLKINFIDGRDSQEWDDIFQYLSQSSPHLYTNSYPFLMESYFYYCLHCYYDYSDSIFLDSFSHNYEANYYPIGVQL